jgi:hypothetical protein
MKQYLQDKSTYRTHRQFGDVGSTLKCTHSSLELQEEKAMIALI